MILVLQTSDFTTHLWLYDNARALAPTTEMEWESGRALSDQLLLKLQEVLATRGASWKDLTAIVIYSGPGSFTSLRIGHATANALADSLGIPVTGATGQDWQSRGLQTLAKTKLGIPALPLYGSEAHITKPKS